MSMFRRAAVSAVVLGAGLVSTAGVALANDCPSESHGHAPSAECQNSVDLKNITEGSGDSLASVLPGAQTAAPINACHILDDNAIANGNSIDLLGGLL
jgi:hypothetical protein